MAANQRKAAAHSRGTTGEHETAEWYRREGYDILERNWRCFEGEIDIIARRGSTLVICEVKARKSARLIDPALAVSHSKQTKVRTAAFRWLEQNRHAGHLRFDVALVVNDNVRVLEAAF